MMNTSRPRTSSSTFTISSPSANKSVRPRPSGISRWSQMRCASSGLARPVKTLNLSASSLDIVCSVFKALDVAGDRGALGHDRPARQAGEGADDAVSADAGVAADMRERPDRRVGADADAGLDVRVFRALDGDAVE